MGSYRVDKVASIVRDIVGEAMTTHLHDPRISPLASVTRVEVSGDLQIARVYISVIGEAATGRRTLAGLTHAAGHIQRLVARQLTIRRCPQLRFASSQEAGSSALPPGPSPVRSDEPVHARRAADRARALARGDMPSQQAKPLPYSTG